MPLPVRTGLADIDAICGYLIAKPAGVSLAELINEKALDRRRLRSAGVIIGSWPADPGLADRANRIDLPVIAGGPLAGAIRSGAGLLGQADFLVTARAGLSAAFGGSFSAEINQ